MEIFVSEGILLGLMVTVLMMSHWLSQTCQREEDRRNEAVSQCREWLQYSIRELQQGKREVEELGEQVMEMRYLLAETCKSLAAAHIAAEPVSLYNDLERLAAEAVRGYEEEGRRGTPRCVPFPPPFKGGSE